jgi:hypothetical protein
VPVRLAVERHARERGWPLAGSPADADALVVVGSIDLALGEVVDVIGSQLPAPWTRVDLLDASAVGRLLDTVPAALADWPAGAAADHTRHQPRAAGGHEGHGARAGHAEHDMPASAGMHDDMPGGHEHDLGMVAGMPMAGRAADRDGLRLDVLHVPVGPVLPYWPAGLRLRLALQGDVVQQVAVEVVGVPSHPAGLPFWDEPVLRALSGERVTAGEVARRRAASHLDSLARLLGVAGWDAPAVRCAVLRDRALAGEPAAPLSTGFAPLARRVDRSRLLRRMTRDLGVLDAGTVDRYGLTGPSAIPGGDVWARLRRWLAAVAADLARSDDGSPAPDTEGPRGALDGGTPPSRALLDVLPPLLHGAELGGARLVVASLDPDLSELVPAALQAGAAHGH